MNADPRLGPEFDFLVSNLQGGDGLTKDEESIQSQLESPLMLQLKSVLCEDGRRFGRIKPMVFVQRHAIREPELAKERNNSIHEWGGNGNNDAAAPTEQSAALSRQWNLVWDMLQGREHHDRIERFVWERRWLKEWLGEDAEVRLCFRNRQWIEANAGTDPIRQAAQKLALMAADVKNTIAIPNPRPRFPRAPSLQDSIHYTHGNVPHDH
jgi:hypothetical protein